MTIFYFIIALGILVLVHEWGHFIIARRSGIRVERFSIGFGPKIIGFRRGGTEFRIAPIPLGGYVKLYGEDPMAEAEGDEAKAKEIQASPDAFSARPLHSRLATVFAGPMMNLFLCLVLMPVVFMVGRMIPVILEKPPVVLGVKEGSPAESAGLQKGDEILRIDGAGVKKWSDLLDWIGLHPGEEARVTVKRNGKELEMPVRLEYSPATKQKIGYLGIEPFYFWGDDPIVGDVSGNSPAGGAGLKAGDKITALNGKPVSSWTEMTGIIRGSGGSAVTLAYRRNGAENTVTVTPKFHEGAKAWVIGITKYIDPSGFARKRYGLFEALKEGTRENIKLLGLTLDVLKRLFTFQLSYKALGGPVQIAQASAMAARSGAGEFLYFLAFLSMQLGILNLLPIPVLDGGHVLFMVLEGVRRKPVSLKVRMFSQQVGLALLLGLMLLVTINDVDSVWGFSNIWEKIKGIF
ncbi:MAG: RIP metalloprotease RseP [Deltaproteobacteria bacterium]|nr:RIP metalloprotease RseP [Deltaproteobacteria bacterium]